MTGAGSGVMGAAQEGAGRERSFGLNIRLPFEQEANPWIADDPKLITFKYFFTRKLFLVREAHAMAYFPGGFGTADEVFETLTLIQTGKAALVPVVLVDAPGGKYWEGFEDFIREHMAGEGMISARGLRALPAHRRRGGGGGGVRALLSRLPLAAVRRRHADLPPAPRRFRGRRAGAISASRFADILSGPRRAGGGSARRRGRRASRACRDSSCRSIAATTGGCAS